MLLSTLLRLLPLSFICSLSVMLLNIPKKKLNLNSHSLTHTYRVSFPLVRALKLRAALDKVDPSQVAERARKSAFSLGGALSYSQLPLCRVGADYPALEEARRAAAAARGELVGCMGLIGWSIFVRLILLAGWVVWLACWCVGLSTLIREVIWLAHRFYWVLDFCLVGLSGWLIRLMWLVGLIDWVVVLSLLIREVR